VPVRRITPEEARALTLDGAAVIDVREPHEWAGGHLPGAQHVPLGLFLRDPASHLRPGPVVFVCAHGIRSLTAAAQAAAHGAPEVYSLDGGTVAWARAGFPLTTG
jgi:rhodanese-related sulfurtransferase